ncbi:hypothetical protein JCM6882_003312 [Rhodosporidiobolus microsporus]
MSTLRAGKRPDDEAVLLAEMEGEVHTQPTLRLHPKPPPRHRRTYPLCILAFLLFFLLLALSPSSQPYRDQVHSSLRSAGDAVASRFRPLEEVQLPSSSSSGAGGEEGEESAGAVGEMRDVCATEHGCRFLVPTTIGEQESRAQHHLLQLASLAHSLNRTLVLPRAYSSRFSTCGTHSFDFFYAPPAFAAATAPASSITQREFERWLANKPGTVGAQAVRLAIPTKNDDGFEANATLGRFMPDPSGTDGNLIFGGKPLMPCLDAEKLDLRGRAPLVRFEPWRFAAQRLLDDLRVLDEQEGAEVLLVHYNLRGPLFQGVERDAMRGGESGRGLESAFEYQREWREVAEEVVGLMMGGAGGGGAAVGVHWRTETLEAERLSVCGASLVGALEKVRAAQPDVEAVYLASDFPIETLKEAPSHRAGVGGAGGAVEGESAIVAAHSDTLSELLTPAHSAAMSSFLRAFSSSPSPSITAPATTNLTLHTFSSLLPSLLTHLRAPRPSPLPSLSHLARYASSAPARSIIDLLVLQRLEVFLAGFSISGGAKLVDEQSGRGVCGKRSNWTRRVGRGREGRWDAQEKEGGEGEGVGEGEGRRLRNVVGTWSAEGTVEGVPGVEG